MRVLQIGNFGPPHSTENELRYALRQLGVEVVTCQEQEVAQWDRLMSTLHQRSVDMVLWTSTYSYAKQIPDRLQREMLSTARDYGIPTVGYHLDRWWGLHANNRQQQMFDADGSLRPFFGVEHLFTADGGHQEQWAEIGVNHHWLPPAVSERWCYLAEAQSVDYDIVFVGGWLSYGHTEWTHRAEMIDKVHGWYGKRFRCLPAQGQPRITMGDLNTIYASAKVVLGDSCLVPYPDGRPMVRYCSDRIPETLGRGGILLHPFVEGITHDVFGHLSWKLENWADLRDKIEFVLAADDWQEDRLSRIDETLESNTYTRRLCFVLDEVVENEGANL